MLELPRTRWPAAFRAGICLALAAVAVAGALQPPSHANRNARSSNTLGAAPPLGYHFGARTTTTLTTTTIITTTTPVSTTTMTTKTEASTTSTASSTTSTTTTLNPHALGKSGISALDLRIRRTVSCSAYTAAAGVAVPTNCAAPRKLAQGETCELACASGYQKVGSPSTLLCAGDAAEDALPSTSISCVEIACPAIDFPPNLLADGSDGSISGCIKNSAGNLSGLTAVTTPSCAVICKPGYAAADEVTVQGTINCAGSGSVYTASASLACLPKQCSTPLPKSGAGYGTSCSAMKTDESCTQKCERSRVTALGPTCSRIPPDIASPCRKSQPTNV